jgi:hypothetical protein
MKMDVLRGRYMAGACGGVTYAGYAGRMPRIGWVYEDAVNERLLEPMTRG